MQNVFAVLKRDITHEGKVVKNKMQSLFFFFFFHASMHKVKILRSAM